MVAFTNWREGDERRREHAQGERASLGTSAVEAVESNANEQHRDADRRRETRHHHR